jgi:hypothetical protein
MVKVNTGPFLDLVRFFAPPLVMLVERFHETNRIERSKSNPRTSS